jgi:hypothetical protein
MPVYECDPWRLQYFADVSCPPDVHILTDGVDAYKFNPQPQPVFGAALEAGFSQSGSL